MKTSEKIAKEVGISKATVERNADYSRAKKPVVEDKMAHTKARRHYRVIRYLINVDTKKEFAKIGFTEICKGDRGKG